MLLLLYNIRLADENKTKTNCRSINCDKVWKINIPFVFFNTLMGFCHCLFVI